MPDVTGKQIIVTRPTKLFGAFYQTPYGDDPRVKDLKTLLEMISDDDTDEVQFISIGDEDCIAFGFMNTTRIKKSNSKDLDLDYMAKYRLIPILYDIDLVTEDHIYDLGEGIQVYLDYTFVK